MQNPATDGRSFISGKVVLEDGTPPPGPVVIERVCNTISRPQGYTDSRGYFSFQLGQNRSQMDADSGPVYGVQKFWTRSTAAPPSASGESNLANISGCDLWRASLPGYVSEVVRLDRADFMEHADSVTIVLSRHTSLLAPTPAKKAFDSGRDAMRKDKLADARKHFEKAVEIFPQYAQAWCQLGIAMERLRDVSGARVAYGKALAEDSKFAKPYLQLAGIAARERNWQELLDTTSRLVEIDPANYPGMFFLNAVAQYNLRNFEAAETSAREALKLDTGKHHPEVNHILGCHHGAERRVHGSSGLPENLPRNRAGR